MQDFSNLTIREIAVASPATARVFEEYKIDYCCGGRRKIQEVCADSGIDPYALLQAINSALESHKESNEPEQMEPSQLIDYIIDKHHVFTRTELFRLASLVEKVSSKHGERHPELYKLKEVFLTLLDDLMPHMKKEEAILFPYIHELSRAKARSTTPMIAPFGVVSHPIGVMRIEHDEAGLILREMRQLTNDYTLPEGACPSFGALYFGLQELEKDLHRHIHLENNVLFPKVVELEEAVFAF
jgi:regulator of cell morphogenesis and NO signaling